MSLEVTDETGMADFVGAATRLGLNVSQRPTQVRGKSLVGLCATLPGQEWRAEAYAWWTEAAQRYPGSERSTYLQSRTFGYSHQQAVQWIEMCRHRSPVHLRHSIYLLLPFAAAKLVSKAVQKLAALELFTIALPVSHDLVLRRDALDLLPPGSPSVVRRSSGGA